VWRLDIPKIPDVKMIKEAIKSKECCELEVDEDQVHGFLVRGFFDVEKDGKAEGRRGIGYHPVPTLRC